MARVPLPSQIEVVDEAVAAILRKKTPAEKLTILESGARAQRLFIEAGIRATNPEWTDAEVERERIRRKINGAN